MDLILKVCRACYILRFCFSSLKSWIFKIGFGVGAVDYQELLLFLNLETLMGSLIGDSLVLPNDFDLFLPVFFQENVLFKKVRNCQL